MQCRIKPSAIRSIKLSRKNFPRASTETVTSASLKRFSGLRLPSTWGKSDENRHITGGQQAPVDLTEIRHHAVVGAGRCYGQVQGFWPILAEEQTQVFFTPARHENPDKKNPCSQGFFWCAYQAAASSWAKVLPSATNFSSSGAGFQTSSPVSAWKRLMSARTFARPWVSAYHIGPPT